ncbi:MAG: CHC2 zinc finger domain-containing protein [Dehalococcoidia bacterium]|nr:CHC2 zinc finger domain-containing protein [Dehalococcoidia bacterium]
MHDTDAIRRDHPIADVVAAAGLEMRPTGGRLVGVCPFHGDTRPSLVVYPAQRSYYCFGCGAGGDVIDFVSRLHRVDFREAVALLAGAHVPAMPAGIPRPPAVAVPEVDPLKAGPLIEAAAAFYERAIWSRPKALDYLASRGIHERTVRHFRLGFGIPGLTAALRDRNLDTETAHQLGLLDEDRECFTGRIIIPDIVEGRATWFTGRRLGDREPRYLNLRLPKPLLGLASAQAEAVVVTEGPFDWLTAVEWGFWAVALLGTRVPGRAAQLLERFDEVYLVLDSDEAGREATGELSERLGDRAVPVALPPGVSDLNSLGCHRDGRSVFTDRILQAGREARVAAQRAA